MIVVAAKDVSVVNSSLLKEIASAVSQAGYGDVRAESEAVQGAKGDLITSLIIDIATNVAASAIYDLVKALIQRATSAAENRGEVPPAVEIKEKDK
jgi:hypothetical protein